MSGIKLQKYLVDRGIDIPVIIVTGHGDVQMAVNAMKSGAFDFIEKPFQDQPLLNLVQRAMVQSHRNASEQVSATEIKSRLVGLTSRERQILDMIVSGKTNRDIADRLGITSKTVEAHRSKVMKKMHTTSLAELIKTMAAFRSVGTP